MRFLSLILVALAGCNKDEIEWTEFNAPNQEITVDVLPAGSPVGPPVSIELVSSVGRVWIGDATVDPGSGPVGTNHLLLVDIFEDYEDLVGRVTVRVRSEAVSDLDGDGEDDARQNDGYELRRDSADPGIFALTLQSLGAPDEERQDRFNVRLWTAEELLADEEEE